MGKEDMTILVFEKKHIFPEEVFEGFSSHEEKDYESLITSVLKSMRRGDAEIDPTHKQPIPYTLIVNPQTKKVFAYKRASKIEHAHESRLHGRWSLGVGGHVEPEDGILNPIRETMLRELLEEVEIEGDLGESKILGYINSEADEVSKVHFGVLYVVEVQGDVKPRDSEIAEGKFISLEELEELIKTEGADVEAWSEIAAGPLKNYFA